MHEKEKELVVIDEEISYNLCEGGKGGFGYLNRTGLNNSGVAKRDYKEIGRKSAATKKKRNFIVSEETRRKISENNARTKETKSKKMSEALSGKPKSEEHKKKISESIKKRWNDKRKSAK